MKWAGLLVALLIIPSCDEGEEPRHHRLMNEIEAQLILPKGALPMAQYARYYAEQGGKVHGAYTTEIEKRPADFGCEEFQADDSTRAMECPARADLKPGRRRWVKFGDYPAVSAEGCRAVQIMYNPKTRSIEYAECATPLH